jgi:hypothetical protein
LGSAWGPSKPAPKFSCLRLEAGTLTGNVLAVAQAADVLLEQAYQLLIAIDQRQVRDAFAVQERKRRNGANQGACRGASND